MHGMQMKKKTHSKMGMMEPVSLNQPVILEALGLLEEQEGMMLEVGMETLVEMTLVEVGMWVELVVEMELDKAAAMEVELVMEEVVVALPLSKPKIQFLVAMPFVVVVAVKE